MPRMSTLSSAPGSLPECPNAGEPQENSEPQSPSASTQRRLARDVAASFRELRRRSRAGDAAQPVSGVCPGHDGLRQVLHLLHRARGARPRAKPAALARSWREARLLADQGVKEITLLGQTVNSYKFQRPGRPVWRLSDLLAAIHEIDGIERIKFITNFPNDMTDDLLQAVRDLPKVSSVPPRAGAERMRRDPEADEADVYGRFL